MLRCIFVFGAVLLVGGILGVGCKAPRPAKTVKPQAGTTVSAAPAESSKPAPGTDWPEERVAQAHAHYGAGVIHEMNERPQEALNEYIQAALDDPENESLVLDVSRRCLQNKQPEKALELLTQAAARPKASGAIYARLGLVYSQLGKYDQAIAASRTAIKRSPDSLPGYQNLFVTYLQRKQSDDALGVLEQAAKQSPADAEFLIGVAELYAAAAIQLPAQKEQIQKKASALLNRAAKLKPAGTALRLRLADAYGSTGNLREASKEYLDLLKALPDIPLLRQRVHAKLAEIYLRESDHKAAIAQLKALIREDPTNPQAYYYLGYLAYEDKQPAEAAEYFGKTVQLAPDFEPAYYDLALAQINLNKPADALATLSKARKKFTENFVMELWTALAYGRQKDYKRALKHYNAAEVIAGATDPKRLNEEFFFQVGAAYERTGDYEQAEKYFDRALKLSPDFAEALNYLGYMWADRGVKLDRARELIEKALKLEPNNAAYLDSLGWVFFKLKQPEEALKYVLKSVELTKEPDATLLDHLGDIYSALGQTEKAREAWRKSLNIEANDQVRKKLDGGAGK